MESRKVPSDELADIHSVVVPKLLEAALLAARSGEAQTSESIIDAVQAVRPGSLKPIIVRAMAALYLGRLREAVEIINTQVLSMEPSNAAALSLLGLAEKRLGNTVAAQQVLSKVLKLNESPQSVALAKTLLEG